MVPKKWKTIWTGSATTGNTISTGINFNNIKRIRFKDDKSNCWHEANIDSFLNGNEMTWGTIYNHFETALTRFYDFCLKINALLNSNLLDKADVVMYLNMLQIIN